MQNSEHIMDLTQEILICNIHLSDLRHIAFLFTTFQKIIINCGFFLKDPQIIYHIGLTDGRKKIQTVLPRKVDVYLQGRASLYFPAANNSTSSQLIFWKMLPMEQLRTGLLEIQSRKSDEGTEMYLKTSFCSLAMEH